jgi:hypothetical protein
MPFNPEGPLESQFAVHPINPALFTIHSTGPEINEMIHAFPSALHSLWRHELRGSMEDADHNLNYKQIWEDLKRNSATEAKSLINRPSMFLRVDTNTIYWFNTRELNI